MTLPDPIDVRRYDKVVAAFSENQGVSIEQVAALTGISARTVRRIYEGSIARPRVVLLERLSQPRRCGECGARCRDWPCIFCEMRRRKDEVAASDEPLKFVYRNSSK